MKLSILLLIGYCLGVYVEYRTHAYHVSRITGQNYLIVLYRDIP